MMERLLTRLPPLSRSQWKLATGLVALSVLVLLAVLLRPGLASLAEVRAQREQAVQVVHAEQLLRQVHRELESELGSEPDSQARSGTETASAGMGEERILFALLGRLSEVAERHQVTLDRLAPAPVRKVAMFRELPVEMALTGSYAQVSAMLLEVAQGGAQVSVSAFQIDRAGAGADVKMRGRFSVYLKVEGKQ